MTGQSFTIGRLGDHAGVNVETIRYYEKIGLMPEPPRTAGGRRVYDAGHLARLRFIRRGRELGFSIGDIRSLSGLEGGAPSCADVLAITGRHLETVRGKIRDLERLETALSRAAEACSGADTPGCPVIDVLSAPMDKPGAP